MTDHVDPASNLEAVLARIRNAADAAGRSTGAVELVAISKMHGEDRILPVIAAGHRAFGENRVQEAAAKWPALRERTPDLTLHLVGPLQSNKIKEAAATFDVIETVDRPKIATALAREFERTGRRLACFIQVNTGEEPQKAGIVPADIDGFVTECRESLSLDIKGLMCIPPIDEAPALHFAFLAKLAERNGLSGLSMGMSGDFEAAIRFGATHIRVGTAIFGERHKDE
ncbi:MAG: YggS family pyridoxal phosphate-dependent enzyme [Proteobacteria bacterium]|nr:YggS family pyridoxal phosphate-dependent enzyme [Pseudomonadota bacterium]